MPLTFTDEQVIHFDAGVTFIMAEWDHRTDQVILNWSMIEQAARETDNDLKGYAKILLAAREAGRCL